MRVPPELFRFATADKSELYVGIMTAFAAANERLVTELSSAEVTGELNQSARFNELAEEEVQSALDQLRAWGAVEVSQNPAGQYRTAADFERRNLIYSLTKQGEAAYAGVTHALAALESTGALQTAVLEALADRLAELATLMGAQPPTPRRTYTALTELDGHLEALRTNTRVFNGELQRLLRAEEVDLDTFMEVKEATLSYLDEFITDLDARAGAIRNALRLVEAGELEAVLSQALAGADLPTLGGADPGPAWLARWQAKWAGLQEWFDPRDGRPARVEALSAVANRAIISLLGALDRIYESRRRPSNAVADFRQLARWFATMPEERDCHLLWVAAFGVYPARHAHLGHPDPDLIPASESWEQAAPVPVSATLRSSGRVERFARTASVRPTAQVRAARREQIRAEAAQAARARGVLITQGPARLSDYGRLDPVAFASLLSLLARALGARPDPDGVRRGMSTDGDLVVELRADALSQQRRASLATDAGVLHAPDFAVTVATRQAR